MREKILGTSVSPRFDLRVGATEHEVRTILGLITLYHIWGFVEIGVHEGGLTEFLLGTFCEYLGIEINEKIVRQEIKDEAPIFGGRFVYGDCMSPEVVSEVASFISSVGSPSIVYCDNGAKKEEIKVYSKIIPSGSILLTHDFTDGERKIRDIENYTFQEVNLQDIEFMEKDYSFQRLPENILKETRLVGWKKL